MGRCAHAAFDLLYGRWPCRSWQLSCEKPWPPRLPWLLAVAAVTLERILTFTFFIPVAMRFMRLQADAPPSAITLAAAWVNLNHVRNLLILTGWVSALYVHGMGP